jgi:methyl coenzyme M reductase beta subunit
MDEEIKNIKKLGEFCIQIGQKLISSSIEELNYENLVQGKRSQKTIIDHFKVGMSDKDNNAYQVYGKFKDYGKKELQISEVSIIFIED